MRVKILEERLSSEDSEGRHHLAFKDDVITVPDDTGEKWCGYGWAEDMAGKVKTGERKVTKGVRVNPQSLRHETKKTTKKGGK